MKSVQFTLTITGSVPDDIDIDMLFINLTLSDVKVGLLNRKGPFTVESAALYEYETLGVEEIE